MVKVRKVPTNPAVRTRLEYLCTALGYAAGYWVLWTFSFSGWTLFSGFRLFLLLVLPYRLWPALFVGELIPLTYIALRWGPLFSWQWGLAMVVPPILFAMPIVKWCRERRIFMASGQTSMNLLLLCCVLVSMVWTVTSFVALLMVPSDRLGSPRYAAVLGEYFLGSYVGTLNFVPLAIAARDALAAGPITALWRRLARSRLVLEAFALLLPTLALLGWFASRGASDANDAARMAMFLPVAWLSLRHGWRGAALGGTAASFAVAMCMPKSHDPGTLRAQAFIAFTVSTMLLLGARIASLYQREARDTAGLRSALALAQRNIAIGEIQLRQTSHALEQIGWAVQNTHTQLLSRLRHLLPSGEECRDYDRQAVTTQRSVYRLADSLYPFRVPHRGLMEALETGAIAESLAEMGVEFGCAIHGAGPERLPDEMQVALYRLAADMLNYVCAKPGVEQVRLRLRSDKAHMPRWVLLSIESRLSDYSRERHVAASSWLGGTGMGLSAIKDRASLFEGKVRTLLLQRGRRISVMLFTPTRD